MSETERILFLDDDPARAEAFRARYPHAIWARTAEECQARLAEPWDVVYLDHDLGGETFVDHERDDCGMEVVRWLDREPRPHLQGTRFVVHTRNPNAACIMVVHLEAMGYSAQAVPFGNLLLAPPSAGRPRPGPVRALTAWLRSLWP
jgi:hypothetical protein